MTAEPSAPNSQPTEPSSSPSPSSGLTPAIRLEARGITKHFGGVHALEGVDLVVRAGDIHAICGENGAGKSTLMKILSGAITNYQGELVLHGRPIRFEDPRDAEHHGISIIHQELNLVPHLTAAANIFLGREPRRLGIFLDEERMWRDAKRHLEQLGATFGPSARVSTLRVGDRQLIEIAKALSLDADLVIMDEPTSALADAEIERLFQSIARLKAEGVTILYISHKMDEIFRLADRITVLRDGRVVRSMAKEETNADEVIRLMVGRSIAALDFEPAEPSGRTVLSVRGLHLPHPSRPKDWRLRDISFDLCEGEIVGVAGLLGSGRTELLECLFGASPSPPQGECLHGKHAGFPRDPAEAIARGIAFVSEDRKGSGLFPTLTVRENMTISALDRLGNGLFLRRGRERRSVDEQMERLRIKADGREAPILSLSGGNQQKCILGRWLMRQPGLLLLDEPTRGIDVGAKAEIYKLLKTLAGQGLTILFTSSELPELLTVADRILVLCEGRLTADLPGREANEERLLAAAVAFAPSAPS